MTTPARRSNRLCPIMAHRTTPQHRTIVSSFRESAGSCGYSSRCAVRQPGRAGRSRAISRESAWYRHGKRSNSSRSLTVALMVCMASLLCGAALYPVVVHLSADNERKAREVLDAQSALIEGLKRSEQELEGKVSQRTLELQREQIRTKELLHNILPIEVAEELSATGSARPARHESVTILFTDFQRVHAGRLHMPADRWSANSTRYSRRLTESPMSAALRNQDHRRRLHGRGRAAQGLFPIMHNAAYVRDCA